MNDLYEELVAQQRALDEVEARHRAAFQARFHLALDLAIVEMSRRNARKAPTVPQDNDSSKSGTDGALND